MKLTRRRFGQFAGAIAASKVIGFSGISLAGNPTGKKLHGLSSFGDLKYGPDYTHFDYVNPDAPKGGTFNFSVANWLYNQNHQSFDTLNTLVLKGNAPPKMEHCFDSLMSITTPTGAGPIDEPSSAYGLLAQSVEISQDRNNYIFTLRPEARFHDETPVLAKDVAFSFDTLKEFGHPDIALELVNLDAVVEVSERVVKLRFNGKQSDQLILTLSGIPIISKAFYTKVDFASSTLEVPLTSGPYTVGRVQPGVFIEYERVKNWWAKDMPFARGLYNFDTLRVEFFRERQAAFEAFKKGDIFYREEFTSKTWATEYDFPAVKQGRIKQQLFPSDLSPSIYGFVMNMRREKLKNAKTREAIGLCFDFEWTNENLFYGAYARNQSYFQNSEFAAFGKPSVEEVALLEPLRGQVPDAVFGEAVQQPVTNGSGKDRKTLRAASELLKEAGWVRKGRSLVDANGEALSVEFLLRSPSFERILSPMVNNLKLVGVNASIRVVDPAQYQKRLEDFDFDITPRALGFPATPTEEGMEQIFSSKYADKPGAFNLPGLKHPAVDALVAEIGKVTSRAELVIVMRALDRVLRSTHSWIPNWHGANHRVAYWDMFGFPETKPDYGFPVELYWWFDDKKAKAIGKG